MATGLLPVIYVQWQVGVGCQAEPGLARLFRSPPQLAGSITGAVALTRGLPLRAFPAASVFWEDERPAAQLFPGLADSVDSSYGQGGEVPLTGPRCLPPHPHPSSTFPISVTSGFYHIKSAGPTAKWLCSLSPQRPLVQGGCNSLFSDGETCG